MRLGGLQRTTLSDFPGRVACAVFTAGCTLRCPYCHNPELVGPVDDAGDPGPGVGPGTASETDSAIDPGAPSETDSAADPGAPSGADSAADLEIDEAAFFAFLDDRADVLDGVVVSGGEPTLHDDLPAFVARIADRGLDVKLDTNGTRPDSLERVLSAGTVEYVAMDLKARPDRYGELGAAVGERVRESVAVVRESGVEHEFRTTFDPGVVSAADFRRLFDLVGDSPLVVQPVETESVLRPDRVTQTPDDPLGAIQEAAGELPPNVELRGT
ncbi:MAG: radical SAM protein [Haloarculaceae archaeon]